MKWTPGGESQDIEDRRDEGGSGGGGFQFGGMHIGIGGAIVLLVLSLIFKQNFFALIGAGGPATAPVASRPDPGRTEAEKPLVQFVSFVLDDTQKNWEQILPQQTGKQYRHAKLVLFRNYTQSGCGSAESATGPFYCPEDERVYIDLGFYDELKRRFGAPGEFAQAYVLAHEVGHHVQKLVGIEAKVRQLQEQNPRQQNPLSVRMELQADCLAGVWAHSTQQRGLLESGDVESALGAAAAVGDDRLQKMATGHVSPETFTHGSSQQRMNWFRKGLDSGSIAACNTFDSTE
ncbi:MAG TPA: neutral zinc metallopeptidase [Candidatus Dormibacteraeota bacterium]|jgi:predicted metalloprotease|nr:neutral zinc metallopeptidase [Candidatus Dormibacteraeota bacterium]